MSTSTGARTPMDHSVSILETEFAAKCRETPGGSAIYLRDSEALNALARSISSFVLEAGALYATLDLARDVARRDGRVVQLDLEPAPSVLMQRVVDAFDLGEEAGALLAERVRRNLRMPS